MTSKNDKKKVSDQLMGLVFIGLCTFLGLLFVGTSSSTSVSLVDEPVTVNTNASDPLATLNYLTECSFDEIVGTECLILSAHNPDVDNSGSSEDLWEGGDLMVYLNTSEKWNMTSTSSEDSLTGTGLRVLFVRGINESGHTVTEILNMNGTNVVQTVNEYLRPTIIVGALGGAAQENIGIITGTSAVTNNLQIEMDETEGISKNSQFTVPVGQEMIIRKIVMGSTKTGGGQSPIVEFKGKVRFFGASIWLETFDFKIDTNLGYQWDLGQPITNQLAPREDFRIEITSSHDNTDVNARIYMEFRDISEVTPNPSTLNTFLRYFMG